MRILVADGQFSVRFALRVLLKQQPGQEVVGEAATAEDLLAQLETTLPDLILLHWRLSERAHDLLQTLHQVCPDLHVIVLSAQPERCREALTAGADAFVCKMDPPEKLLEAISRMEASENERRAHRKAVQARSAGAQDCSPIQLRV